MAEGGGIDFGIDQKELDKNLDNDDDGDGDDDDDKYDFDVDTEIDTTKPAFQPDAESTRYGEQIEMQTFQKEKSGLPETSFDEDIPLLSDFVHQDDKPALLERARDLIKRWYPRVDFGKLGPIGFSKKPGNDTTIVSFGKKAETEIFRKDGKGLYKKFTDKFKSSLGPDAESLIAHEKEEIRNERLRLRDAEKQLRDAQKLDSEREKAAQEVRNLRTKIGQTQAQIETIHEEQGTNLESESELRRLQQLKKNLENDFEKAKKDVSDLQKKAKTKAKEQKSVDQLRAKIAAKESERNTVEARLNDTRTLDELKEQEAELQRQNKEDQAVIDDENTSPSDKQAAEGRVAERQEELARLQTQIDERERVLPLRERVKEIFKKYGVTVTAIILAAGVTIGAVIGAITNALRATGKALGKGLKNIGSKIASALPGLIGSIVSFLFKAAGQAIGFLAEHTWLIILAVFAFLVEKYIKKRC